MRIGIVADDLTGAADSAAPFARRGGQAFVGFTLDRGAALGRYAGDALSLNAGTRDLQNAKPTLIASITRRAARRLIEFAPTLYYKKIDSTLRGHLRVELDAMRRELPNRLALICPAFPANGRTVAQGVLHLHGVPWTQTEFAPTRPLAAPAVRAAFDFAGDSTTAELSLGAVREGVDALEHTLNRLADEGVQTFCCDAVTQTDLEILAQVILRQPDRYLPVGSAGLAAAIAACLPAAPLENLASPPSLARNERVGKGDGGLGQAFKTGRVLVVVGSLHPASRQQAAFLAAKAGIEPIRLEFSKETTNFEIARQQLHTQMMAKQRIAMLMTSELPSSMEPVYGLSNFVAWALEYPHRWRFSCLVVTGGDTALHVLGRLGSGIRVTGETQPGVITGHLKRRTGGKLDGLPVITKAGGFGMEETLARCVGLVE
ncbi:MAG TPA: four-carbon acid sugar kinase family protein [Chthonomonadaceae bacterium]|nr:four-carbon acid sugar kinase family protein [Chthonomonadaceae bacterium]